MTNLSNKPVFNESRHFETPTGAGTIGGRSRKYLAPTSLTEFWDFRKAKKKAYKENPKKNRVQSVYPGLLTYLKTFMDSREIGIKLSSWGPEAKPKHLLSTEILQDRIDENSRDNLLDNWLLDHYYNKELTLYYCNRIGSDYIYPYLDFDSKGHDGRGDTLEAIEYVKRTLKIQGHHQATTNGAGFYPKIKISLFETDIRGTLIQFASELTKYIQTAGFEGIVEAKALPAETDLRGFNILSRGVLGRIPIFESLECYESFKSQRAYSLSAFRSFRANKETSEEPSLNSELLESPSIPRKPKKTRKNKQTMVLERPTPEEEPCAFKRMIRNCYAYSFQYGCQPDIESLLKFYEEGPSARGDEDKSRTDLASRVIEFCTSKWTDKNVTPPSDPTTPDYFRIHKPIITLNEVAKELEEIQEDDRSIYNSGQSRWIHLSLLELNLVYSTIIHNFFHNDNHRCPVTAIQALWEIAYDKGILNRGWRPEFYSIAKKILMKADLIVLTKKHEWKGGRTTGKAAIISPGKNSSRYDEGLEILESLKENITPPSDPTTPDYFRIHKPIITLNEPLELRIPIIEPEISPMELEEMIQSQPKSQVEDRSAFESKLTSLMEHMEVANKKFHVKDDTSDDQEEVSADLLIAEDYVDRRDLPSVSRVEAPKPKKKFTSDYLETLKAQLRNSK